MFSKLFTIAIAIIFWPVTLLIFGWAMLHTFLTTKVNYTPPTDPETGKALKSFYFGGEWEEIDLPSNEELITAWMFLLHGLLFPCIALARRRQTFFANAHRVWGWP